jgi:hypothetical protein
MSPTEEQRLLFKQDKDFWKYCRMQMLWLFIVGILCAIYELLIGFVGIFFVDIAGDNFEAFILLCNKGIRNKQTVWDAETDLADLFLVLHTVVIIMWSMIHYIVFFTIPYKYNRIKKTDSEIDNEEKELEKKRLRKLLKVSSKD